jgi:A nuclease family of the HNH/ENDO VII superfamily with conserved AHH/Pretoxin HINT domain
LIETTPQHPFYVEGVWVAAEDLEVGMTITSAGDLEGAITATEHIEHTQEMFNLTVAEAHTYFVGEGQWLVHNACSQELKKAMLAAGEQVPDGFAAHHLIPGETEKSHDLVKTAIANGWDIDGPKNGMALPTTDALSSQYDLPLHNTNHPEYTDFVKGELDDLEDAFDAALNSGQPWSKQRLFDELDALGDRLTDNLNNMGGNSRVPKGPGEIPGW